MLSEQALRYLEEASGSSVSSNTKGVLHELLVGYHLRGGSHMERHPDVDGDSPKQAHDKLKASLPKEDYDRINRKAKAAADDIKKRVGGKVRDVHWTSKPGDLERSTGIKASQKEDASDIVVHSGTKSKPVYHGISLKVSDKKGGEVPVSNPGLESTYGGDKLLEQHRSNLLKAHPKMKKVWDSNKPTRKKFLTDNPKIGESVRKKNNEFLTSLVDHVHSKLNSMGKNQLSNHIRNVINAKQTPMQKQGHNHIRHTTHGTDDHSFSAMDPSQHHEHILNDVKNISVDKSGTSVHFKYKGKTFARHRFKFESQSDPKSSVKGSGELVGSHSINEDAPANSMGASGINGLGASVGGIAGFDKILGIVRRRKRLRNEKP